MYRSLLVPLDGSAFAEQALPVALTIARRAGAELQVVTVVSNPWTRSLSSAQSSLVAASGWPGYLQGVVERAQRSFGVSVTSQVLEAAEVAPVLCAHARDAGVDLVIMSTHGRGALGKLWFGSTAYEMVHRLSMPLLFVRPTEITSWEKEPALHHLLITLDGTALAEQILAPALTLGVIMDAEYYLLRVINDLPVGSPELDSISLSSPAEGLLGEIRSVQERARKEALGYLEGIAERLRAQGLVVKTQVVVASDPGAAVLDVVNKGSCDVVALETHGRRGLAGLVLGSVARKVIHGTTKLVLIRSAESTSRAS
jgi:nucleotide-binding universal stress UspA family protein